MFDQSPSKILCTPTMTHSTKIHQGSPFFPNIASCEVTRCVILSTPSTQDPCDPHDAQSCRKAISFGEGVSYLSRIVIVTIVEQINMIKRGHTHIYFIIYVTCTHKTKVYLQCQISFLTQCNPDFQLFLEGMISFASVAGRQEAEQTFAPSTLGCFHGTRCF